ncbi:set domain protein [Culex quinquefasciatus]|uniref:Set domain protein n=1 Tax=Culex quinquefasciatus TaxID=7176 RepID=B0WRF0_CULQU|nr:set domain protein [Culex quinquefasciatus]|eukprot:XP_001851284.1 set domain protein [Culex quinquefasciatus]
MFLPSKLPARFVAAKMSITTRLRPRAQDPYGQRKGSVSRTRKEANFGDRGSFPEIHPLGRMRLSCRCRTRKRLMKLRKTPGRWRIGVGEDKKRSSYQLDRHTGLPRPVHSMSFFVPDVKCIPAGFQLLTTSIMICPKHSLEQCSINGNGAIRAESHLHLQLRVQVLARAHDSPASGPGRGIPAATQAKGHLREVINNEELPRRIYQKDENYYFLTVDSEQTIDAGPKGNLARFINYSSPTARRCCGRSAEANP